LFWRQLAAYKIIDIQYAPLKQSNGQFCKANLASVYKCLFDQDFDAHDALEDVIALKRILFSPEMSIDVKTIVNRSQISLVRTMKSDMEFIDFRHDRYQTFVGNLHCPNEDHSPISHGMALKIAGSGLSYSVLHNLWEKFGETGVVGILFMPPYNPKDTRSSTPSDKNHPRATKSKRILSNVVKYFQSCNVSNISTSS
jgi:hypothetical protein